MKIAVFRALQLGDLLCALPAIACIKKNFPSATLYVIGLPHMEALMRRYAFVDGLIVFPGYLGLPEQPEPTCEKQEEFIATMCEMSFDVLFQMHGDGTLVNDLLKRWKAKRLIGFCPQAYMAGEDWMVYPEGLHEVERHLQLLDYVGLIVSKEDRHMLYPLSKEDWDSFENLKVSRGLSHYVIVHVGSRHTARQWPLENFRILTQFLQQKGWQIVLTGSMAESELVHKMEQMLDREVINLAGQTDLGQLGCLVRNAGIVLCNCTGISHVAAALETKSIVISLDGEPERWGPINKELHYTYDGRLVLDMDKIKHDINQLLSAN